MLALAILAAGAGYFVVGSQRMVSACTRDDVAPAGVSGTETTWSWFPPGFECRYDDGTVKRSLWWSP